MLRKDKKFKHGEAIRQISRPPSTLSTQDKKSLVDSFYKKAGAAAEPFSTDTYMDLLLPPDELADVRNQLNQGFASPTKLPSRIRVKKPDLRKGLPNILLADVSSKPPTLEDYLRLGNTLALLSEEERKTIQWMLDKSLKGDDK